MSLDLTSKSACYKNNVKNLLVLACLSGVVTSGTAYQVAQSTGSDLAFWSAAVVISGLFSIYCMAMHVANYVLWELEN